MFFRLVLTARKKSSTQQELIEPNAKCHHCGQLGHVEKICKSQHLHEDVKIVEDELEEELLLATSCVTTNKSTKCWLINSACINHMIHDRKLFKRLNKSNISKVRIGNGEQLALTGRRTIAIKIPSGVKLISYVLYVPEINQNLLSVAQLLEKGYKVTFENKFCE